MGIIETKQQTLKKSPSRQNNSAFNRVDSRIDHQIPRTIKFYIDTDSATKKISPTQRSGNFKNSRYYQMHQNNEKSLNYNKYMDEIKQYKIKNEEDFGQLFKNNKISSKGKQQAIQISIKKIQTNGNNSALKKNTVQKKNLQHLIESGIKKSNQKQNENHKIYLKNLTQNLKISNRFNTQQKNDKFNKKSNSKQSILITQNNHKKNFGSNIQNLKKRLIVKPKAFNDKYSNNKINNPPKFQNRIKNNDQRPARMKKEVQTEQQQKNSQNQKLYSNLKTPKKQIQPRSLQLPKSLKNLIETYFHIIPKYFTNSKLVKLTSHDQFESINKIKISVNNLYYIMAQLNFVNNGSRIQSADYLTNKALITDMIVLLTDIQYKITKQNGQYLNQINNKQIGVILLMQFLLAVYGTGFVQCNHQIVKLLKKYFKYQFSPQIKFIEKICIQQKAHIYHHFKYLYFNRIQSEKGMSQSKTLSVQRKSISGILTNNTSTKKSPYLSKNKKVKFQDTLISESKDQKKKLSAPKHNNSKQNILHFQKKYSFPRLQKKNTSKSVHSINQLKSTKYKPTPYLARPSKASGVYTYQNIQKKIQSNKLQKKQNKYNLNPEQKRSMHIDDQKKDAESQSSKQTLFNVEVDLGYKSTMITVRKGQDPKQIVKKFNEKYNLTTNSIIKLQKLLAQAILGVNN